MENVPMKGESKPHLIQVSDALFQSNLFPNVKNKFGAFAIVQYGAELGLGPMTSLQTMAIVSGKICMAAQMMLALAVKNGVTYKIIASTNEKAEIQFKGDTEYTSMFAIEDAKRAGIWKTQSGWEKYPKDMCFWRAVTAGIRRVKPGVVLGLYAIEELQDAPDLNSPSEVNKLKEQDKPKPDFDFLKKMGEAKKAFKELTGSFEPYYEVLIQHNYEHSNDVKEEDRKAIYEQMQETYKAMAKQGKEEK